VTTINQYLEIDSVGMVLLIESIYLQNYFTPFLSNDCGLRGILAVKSGENAVEGVATFYNPNKFKFLESETVNIREEMKKLSFYDTLPTVPGLTERLDDRNTVLQVSVLQHVGTSHVFVVGKNLSLCGYFLY